MNKMQFLNNPQIKNFINWFKKPYLEEDGFIHQYSGTSKTPPLSCSHIEEVKHYWPLSYKDPISGQKVFMPTPDFTTTKNHLDYLASILTRAYDLKDEASIAKAWKAIYEWGGVFRQKYIKSHFKSLKSQGRLLSEIEELVNIVNTFELNSSNKVYMDSGLTKVLSLLVPSIIIYDSRVSAALCFLIRKFCEDSNLQEVPEVLHIHSLESSSKKGTRNRNASTTQYKFKTRKTINNSGLRFEDTIKASWLVEGIIQKYKSPKDKGELYSLMHELEAKLFMIGFDVPGKRGEVKPYQTGRAKLKKIAHKPELDKSELTELHTLGRNNSFYIKEDKEFVHFFSTNKAYAFKVPKTLLRSATEYFNKPGVYEAGLSATNLVKGGWAEWFEKNSGKDGINAIQRPTTSRILAFLNFKGAISYEKRKKKLMIQVEKPYSV